MIQTLLVPLVLLHACAPTSISLGDDTAAADVDTDTDAETDTDTDTDTDPDTDTDTVPAEVAEAFTLTVHPEVSTVLVARWTQLVAGDTSLYWDVDGERFSSPVRALEPGDATEVVLGLPADIAVTVTLNVGGRTLTTSGATDPLPRGLSDPTLTTWDPVAADPSPYLLTSVDMGTNNFFGPCWVVMLDRAGRIVWYRAVSDRRLTLFPRVARDGSHVLWDATTYYVPDVVPGSITRATLSLSQEVETEVEGIGFTYDELEDGSFLFDYAETAYDYHLERQYPDGTRERIWSCAPWMDTFNTDYWACAANTVRWDPVSNVVIWSMFHTSTVVGIDLATGAQVWELGEYPGGLNFEPAIRLELQHYPNWTPDGTVLLTTHVPGEPGVQRIRELDIDVGAGVARQVWTYSPAAGYYGDYAGEATRLANGNTLVNFGTDGVVQEITGASALVWEIDWDDHLVGHLTPVDDLYALDGGW